MPHHIRYLGLASAGLSPTQCRKELSRTAVVVSRGKEETQALAQAMKLWRCVDTQGTPNAAGDPAVLVRRFRICAAENHGRTRYPGRQVVEIGKIGLGNQ